MSPKAQPMHVASPVINTDGQAIVDMSQNPTRNDVAEMFGVTVQAVRKWERNGKLHSMNDAEGTARFTMAEVAALQKEKDGGTPPTEFDGDDEDEARSRMGMGGVHPRFGSLGLLPTDNASLELSVVGKLLNLIVKPRERLDELLFRALETSHRRTEQLEERVNKMTDAVQLAEDRTAERDAVAQQIRMSENRTTTVMNRIMGTFDKLVNKGGTPFLTSLTTEQLEALIEGGTDAWRPEQLKAMQAVLDERKAAEGLVQNGVNAKGATTAEGEASS